MLYVDLEPHGGGRATRQAQDSDGAATVWRLVAIYAMGFLEGSLATSLGFADLRAARLACRDLRIAVDGTTPAIRVSALPG